MIVFELELFEPSIGFSFLAWKRISRDRLPPRFIQRLFHRHPFTVSSEFQVSALAVLKKLRFRPVVAEKPLILFEKKKTTTTKNNLGASDANLGENLFFWSSPQFQAKIQ